MELQSRGKTHIRVWQDGFGMFARGTSVGYHFMVDEAKFRWE